MQASLADQREHARHYIPASESDISAMLATVGKQRLDDLFDHIPSAVRFAEAPGLPEELDYDALKERLSQIAAKNRIGTSFLGDGVPDFVLLSRHRPYLRHPQPHDRLHPLSA